MKYDKEKAYFNEEDKIEFNSAWGVSNSDTGKAVLNATIDVKEYKKTIKNQVWERHSFIQNDTLKLLYLGSLVSPNIVIKNFPVHKVDIDLEVLVKSYSESPYGYYNVDQKVNTKNNINIPLPKGARSAEEWTAALKQAIPIAGIILSVASLGLGIAFLVSESIIGTGVIAASISNSVMLTFLSGLSYSAITAILIASGTVLSKSLKNEEAYKIKKSKFFVPSNMYFQNSEKVDLNIESSTWATAHSAELLGDKTEIVQKNITLAPLIETKYKEVSYSDHFDKVEF